MLKLIPHFRKHQVLRLGFAGICAVYLLLLSLHNEVRAHELEDGFVERAVAVVVRPGNATISYSIGANEATRQQLTTRWSGGEGSGASDSVPNDGDSQEGGDASFLRVVGAALLEGTDVEVDGLPVDLELIEVIPTPRHHVEATVVMRLKMPKPAAGAPSMLLTVHDGNFATEGSQEILSLTDGAFRYAIKGAQGVMLNRSTVAPILVRSKRRLIAEIPADQIDAEQQFSAEIILP